MMPYRTYIDTSDFDEERYPIPPKPITPSATECVHTPHPEGYMQHHEWMRMASRTHSAIRCPHCGLWAVWIPKLQAMEINKAEAKAARAVSKAYQKHFDRRLKEARAEQRKDA